MKHLHYLVGSIKFTSLADALDYINFLMSKNRVVLLLEVLWGNPHKCYSPDDIHYETLLFWKPS